MAALLQLETSVHNVLNKYLNDIKGGERGGEEGERRRGAERRRKGEKGRRGEYLLRPKISSTMFKFTLITPRINIYKTSNKDKEVREVQFEGEASMMGLRYDELWRREERV